MDRARRGPGYDHRRPRRTRAAETGVAGRTLTRDLVYSVDERGPRPSLAGVIALSELVSASSHGSFDRAREPLQSVGSLGHQTEVGLPIPSRAATSAEAVVSSGGVSTPRRSPRATIRTEPRDRRGPQSIGQNGARKLRSGAIVVVAVPGRVRTPSPDAGVCRAATWSRPTMHAVVSSTPRRSSRNSRATASSPAGGTSKSSPSSVANSDELTMASASSGRPAGTAGIHVGANGEPAKRCPT